MDGLTHCGKPLVGEKVAHSHLTSSNNGPSTWNCLRVARTKRFSKRIWRSSVKGRSWAISAASFLILFPCIGSAQSPVRFIEAKRIFVLDAGNSSYVFGINDKYMLQHIYWGKHVWRDDDFAAAQSLPEWAAFDLTTTITPQEYPGWGAGLSVEPSLKTTF